jgi:hypothetical protein
MCSRFRFHFQSVIGSDTAIEKIHVKNSGIRNCCWFFVSNFLVIFFPFIFPLIFFFSSSIRFHHPLGVFSFGVYHFITPLKRADGKAEARVPGRRFALLAVH